MTVDQVGWVISAVAWVGERFRAEIGTLLSEAPLRYGQRVLIQRHYALPVDGMPTALVSCTAIPPPTTPISSLVSLMASRRTVLFIS